MCRALPAKPFALLARPRRRVAFLRRHARPSDDASTIMLLYPAAGSKNQSAIDLLARTSWASFNPMNCARPRACSGSPTFLV